MDDADVAALESFDANGSMPNGNSSSSAAAAPNGAPSSAAEASGKKRLKITCEDAVFVPPRSLIQTLASQTTSTWRS